MTLTIEAPKGRQPNRLDHGHGRRGARTSTYNSWRAMIERCSYERHPFYADYGGRGISVYEGWRGRGGFQAFLDHLGPRPDGMTLDRIDPDGNYEPGNVRWASKFAQRWNRRDMAARAELLDDPVFWSSREAPEPAGMPF